MPVRGRFPLLFALLSLIGCTKPPAIPVLDRHSTNATDRLVLDYHLELRDYRSIFDAVNEDGKLNSLKPYFTDAADANLEPLGTLVSRYGYEEAHWREGLIALLESRIESRGFTKALESARKWAADPTFRAERNALLALAADERLPELVARDRGVLDETWVQLLRLARDKAKEYEESQNWEGREPLTGKLILDDVKKFLASSQRAKLPPLLGLLKQEDFGNAVLKAMGAMRAQTHAKGFEGLGHGLKELLPTEARPSNELEKIFGFLTAADSGSDGIFLSIQKKFRDEPDFAHEFANLLKPMIAEGTTSFWKEILSSKKVQGEGFYDKKFWLSIPDRPEKHKPSPSFVQLFFSALRAIERITGPAHSATVADDAFVHNLPIYTNAFALARWAEGVIKHNRDKKEWKEAPEENFQERIWDLPVEVPEIVVDLSETPEADNPKVTALKEMTEIGLKDFAGLVEQVVGTQQFGKFYYQFGGNASGTTFRDAFTAAIKNCDETRPFADPSSFLRALIYPLTRPDASSFSLDKLETDNLLAGINRLLAVVPLEHFRSFKRTIFEDMQLLRLNDPDFDTRKLMLRFFPEEKLNAKVISLLDTFPSLYEFDRSIAGLPSPFEAYLEVIAHTPARQMKSVSKVLGYVGESGFFKITDAGAEYPAIVRLIRNAKALPQGLYGLGWFASWDFAPFLSPVLSAIGNEKGDGADLHLKALEAVLAKHAPGLEALLDRALEDGDDMLETFLDLPKSERHWVKRLVENEDFTVLWRFLSTHGGRESMRQLMTDLSALQKRGYLREAFNLLKQVRNDRLKRIGEVLLHWDRSGELAAGLTAAELLLQE